jgi:surface polysaccharide O-acyltransferase-like enzyme
LENALKEKDATVLEMAEQSGDHSRRRIFYLDNLRVYLTILVILHHAAMAYSGTGDWSVRDPAIDDISPIFLTFFTAINQSYFMAAFFLIAGYFTPRSLDKKGSAGFINDRLIRLGIPLLLFTPIIFNINEYLYTVYYLKQKMFSLKLTFSPAHLWFLQALLIFTIIYVVYRLFSDRIASNNKLQVYQDRFPPNTTLVWSIIILTVLTFAVRLMFPVGSKVADFQFAHFVLYAFSFYVGIMAQRGDWFNRLKKRQARQWGIVSLIVIPLILVLMIGDGSLDIQENVVKFLGGMHWQAFGYALWETILFIGITVSLLYFFRDRFYEAGSLLRSMARSVYTVYIIHLTLLWWLNIVFLSIRIPTILKFFIVSMLTIPLSFLLSSLIRKIPYATRVLG